MPDSKKYIFAFVMTVAIFATALFISNSVSEGKLAEIQNIQNRLSLDILASETQSALLEETSCKNVNQIPLTKELGELAERLAAAEEQSGSDNQDVQSLKKQYFLLEIRDYLLMKKISEKCGVNPTFILYFYANETDCEDCQKMGFVLTALHEEFPDLRIYSFDYNMDLEALHTLRTIYGLGETLPAIVINGDPYYGFRPLNELVESVPALSRLRAEQIKQQKKATTTKSLGL
ncbi:MAG TPA: thioredoxin family protein [Parcubacteria group bacterium]|nr:thioredoxin family protein [Parcubacteria group bacterium]